MYFLCTLRVSWQEIQGELNISGEKGRFGDNPVKTRSAVGFTLGYSEACNVFVFERREGGNR